MESATQRFMLRRTLFPWKFEQAIDEAVAFAREYSIDEVIWKIDAEEFSHGLPTLERIATYIPWLTEAKKRLSAAGASMSINPWVTIGMRDAGWDLRKVHTDFEWLTDITGIQARSQGCPLSPGWRNWFLTALEMYASTRPHVLWIEDDIRLIRHRPVYYSCYCPRHLEEFTRRTGRQFTREQLAAEILKPGEPSPVRAAWLSFLGATMAELFELLAGRVYGKFPEVRLGLMCSAPWMHAAETRDWDRALKALAGPHSAVTIRPCMGNYQESSPRGLYETRQYVGSTLACVRRPVQACGEVENWPFTRFSKSVRFSRAQVLLGMAMGCSALTFNAYDHVGTPLDAEPQYGQMLRELRLRVEALVKAYHPGGRERGVRMFHHEQGPHFKRLSSSAHFGHLMMGPEPWAEALQPMGLSVTWADSDAVAVTGPKLLAYKGQLDELFCRGVLLDLSALQTLAEMGREDLAGVKVAGTFLRKERETPVEQLIDPEFGQQGDSYMTVDHVGLETRVGILDPAPGARVISKLVNPDRQPVLDGAILFENALGGRVATVPYDFGAEVGLWFLNWHRQRQLHAVANWLFRGALPLSVAGGAWPLAIRTDYVGAVLVSVMNLSLDDWPGVRLDLHGDQPLTRVQRLMSDGQWQTLPPGILVRLDNRILLRDAAPIAALDMATYRFE